MPNAEIVRDVRRFHNASPAPKTLSISAAAATTDPLGCWEIRVTATVACFILIAENPTATVANGHYIPAATPVTIQVDPQHKLSAIAGGAGSLYISAVS